MEVGAEMAYFGKLGGLVRLTVARSVLQQHGGALAVPAMYLTQRGMAGSKLFIGGKHFKWPSSWKRSYQGLGFRRICVTLSNTRTSLLLALVPGLLVCLSCFQKFCFRSAPFEIHNDDVSVASSFTKAVRIGGCHFKHLMQRCFH